LDEIYYPHSHCNQTVPPRVPSRGMYDRLNPVSTTPDDINEEDDLFTNKNNYRKKIRKLQMSIRPIGNEKSTNSPDYNQIQNTNLYRTLIPYYTYEDGINEKLNVGPNYDFNWYENNNHNYSDFIREFNKIHPPDFNDVLLHPLNPPRQVRRSFSFTDPPFRNNYIQPSNLPNNTTQEFLRSLREEKKKKNNRNNKNNKKK
jgi:hypothetical protein